MLIVLNIISYDLNAFIWGSLRGQKLLTKPFAYNKLNLILSYSFLLQLPDNVI